MRWAFAPALCLIGKRRQQAHFGRLLGVKLATLFVAVQRLGVGQKWGGLRLLYVVRTLPQDIKEPRLVAKVVDFRGTEMAVAVQKEQHFGPLLADISHEPCENRHDLFA
jgi:hypothetical protein